MMKITTMTKTLLASSIIALCSFHAMAKEVPPAGGAPKDFSLPATETITLDNGLKVTFIPYGTTPKATLQLRTNTGNIDDGEHVWLADISYEMLRQGTKTKTAKELAETVASMGGSIDSSVGMDSSYLGMSVLSEFADEAVNVIADLALNANFAESDLERIKNDSQRRLSVSKSNPSSIATEAFYKSIYGNHPYGKLYPTSESVGAISAQDTVSFVSTNLVPNRSHLYVSGVFNKNEVAAAVKSAFEQWEKGAISKRKTVITQTGPSMTMLERKDAPQSTLRLGLATIPPSHPDYMGLNVMNTLLGGAFSSRITSNIREDKGYTYSPNSSVVTRVGSGLWYQGADVTAEATGASLHEIVKEINLLAKEVPSQEELSGIQNYMAGIFVLRNSSRSAIISQLAFIELHGLDQRYLEDYVKTVYAISPKDISDVTKKYLKVDNMHLTIVGDTKAVAPQLKEIEALKPFM
jgi:zinc protease